MPDCPTYHIPVLLRECVEALQLRPGGCYVDVTFGGGGHSREILRQMPADAHLYSFDQDADAERNIPQGDDRFTFVRSNFRYLRNWMRYYGVEKIDGLLADLGVSSHHFDDEQRGFSFRYDAPLDMRMNSRAGMTAAQLLNTADEEELTRILRLYGEMKNPHRLAMMLVSRRRERPFSTTGDLADCVRPLLGAPREEGYGQSVSGTPHCRQPRNGSLGGNADSRHPVAGTRRPTGRPYLPFPGRPTGEKLHASRQRRRQSRARLLRQPPCASATCEQ